MPLAMLAQKSRPQSGFFRLRPGAMLGAASSMLSAVCGAEVPLDFCQAGTVRRAYRRTAAAYRLVGKSGQPA